jgi:hypothetical protein
MEALKENRRANVYCLPMGNLVALTRVEFGAPAPSS